MLAFHYVVVFISDSYIVAFCPINSKLKFVASSRKTKLPKRMSRSRESNKRQYNDQRG